MESIWSRAFNSFGFIALLICGAVLLTTISSPFAAGGRNQARDLVLLQSQGALMADIRVTEPGFRTRNPLHN
jgi:hypothetical protein